jgi:hypothetical protein
VKKVWLTNDLFAIVTQPVPGRLIVEYDGRWLAGEFDGLVGDNELSECVTAIIQEVEANPVMIDRIEDG